MITDDEVQSLSKVIADMVVSVTIEDAEKCSVLIPNQEWFENSLIAGAVFFMGVLSAEGKEHGFTVEEFLGACERMSKCKALSVERSILTDIRKALVPNPPKTS